MPVWEDILQLITLCGLIGAVSLWYWNRDKQRNSLDSESTDPGLLKKYTTFQSYTTSFATYPLIRTFYRTHSQADKLPSIPNPLPLLVFVHGLGGSLAQFNPLLTSLVNIAPCLGIDLPGCGLSDFAPTAWECYTPEALVELLGKVIEKHITSTERQGVVLIAHSMGCSLSALLACPESILRANQHINILGLVALCPRASPLSEQERAIYSRLLRLPTMLFDVWRRWDRRGGPESNSVARFVGKDADLGVKKLQERFNAQRRSLVLYDRLHPFAAQRLLIWYVYGTWMSVQQPSPSPLQSFRILTVRLKKSRTPVWRRMALGMLPSIHGPTVKSGLPGLSVWATLDIPLLLIGGRNDQVTKPEEVEKISGELEARTLIGSTKELTGRRKTVNRDIFRNGIQQGGMKPTETNDHGQTNEAAPRDSLGITFYSRNNQVVRTKILPAPASHALPYDPITYRTVAGNIQPFLADFVDSRLSIGWQLTYLSTEGKWDVKNLKKWRDVDPVSGPIAGIFRAMKTLRQIDDRHSPKEFIHDWGSKIYAVIDISHDSPVYDPKDFEEGSIGYYKLPSVSKIPPTTEETQEFIQLVDRLRTNRDAEHEFNALIGVHCHYGFNRTGFFICAYLIEREGYRIKQATDEFKRHRPDGIKHEHFLNTLFARYPQT